MNYFIATATLLLTGLLSGQAIAESYRWVDDQGNTVYSQKPPPDEREVKAIAAPPPPAESPEQSQQRLEQQIQNLNESNEKRLADKEEAAEKKAQAKHNQQQCENARAQQELLNNRPPQTLFRTSDGEYKRFTQEERDERNKKANEAIKQYCR